MIATRAEILTYLGKASDIIDADMALLDLVHASSDAAVRNYMRQELEFQQHVELLPVGQPISSQDAIAEPYLRDNQTVGFMSRQPTGSDALQLKHLPVFLADIEVREDVGANAGQETHAFPTETILTLGDDYFLDVDDPTSQMSRTGLLYRFGRWPTEPRCVKVTYYGGLSASRLNRAWADVKMAAIIAAAEEFQVAKRRQGAGGSNGPVQSESIGRYSYSLGGNAAAVAAGGGYALPAGSIQRLFRHRNLGGVFG